MRTQKLLLTILVVGLLSFTSYSESTDEIISKHAAAIGGLDNWAKIKTLKMDMAMKMQGMEVVIAVSQVNCTAMRTDITVMGMSGYTINTKTNGWNYMPFNGQTKPEPMTDDMVKAAQDQLCVLDKLLWYKDAGDKIEDLGKDDVDGTECFKLKLTDSNGKETTYYLDTETYLITKQTVKATISGQVMENSVTMGNYQKLDEGIVIAMSTQTQGGEIEVKKVEINPVIDENIFKLPN